MAKKADIFDMNRDAETHSDGQMSVKKVLKKPALIMKSYHSAKDGEKFAKKFGYKVSNYVKTFNGSRMDIVKEETEKKFKDLRTEISQKTIDSYKDKAGKQYRKAAGKMGSSDKAKKTFIQRHKGLGSVMKRDLVKKSGQSMVPKAGRGSDIMKGKGGHAMTSKPASRLAKSYKDR